LPYILDLADINCRVAWNAHPSWSWSAQ